MSEALGHLGSSASRVLQVSGGQVDRCLGVSLLGGSVPMGSACCLTMVLLHRS